ncbi:MAG: FHA domain-containing protein [Phycisphaerales bacterium]
MPSLIVVTSHADAKHHTLRGRTVELGRGEGCDVQVVHDSVSRKHCRIQFHKAANAYSVEDLGSSNGTLVNGAPADGQVPLRDGDEIAIGQARVRYTDEDFETGEDAFEHAIIEKWFGEDDRNTVVG